MRTLTEFYKSCMRWVRPRAKKIVLGVAIFFAALTVVGFFVLPPILKYVLVSQLSANLHRPVAIDRVRFNPYALSLTVRGLAIKERTGAETFVSCREVYANLGSFSALRLAPVLDEVRLSEPYVRIVRNRDLSYNFSDLLTKSDSKPFRFALNNISIEKGSIDFLDMPVDKKHTVRELSVGVPFLSNIPSYVERFVQPHFSAKIDDAPYVLKGRTKPFADSLETIFDIDIRDLDLPYYMAYVPVKTNFRLSSGKLTVGARLSFVETKAKKGSLTVSGDVSVKTLAVRDLKDETLLQLPLLAVSIAPSEPLVPMIHLSKVSIQSPEITIRRDKQGAINILSLLPAKGKAAPALKGTENPVALSLNIDAIRLTAGKLSFSDLSGRPFETTLSPTDVSIDNFSLAKDKKAMYVLSTQTEAKETIKVQGQFSLDPLWSEGAVELAALTLKKYSPYYSDQVLFNIEDGRLDLSTRYLYAAREKEPEMKLSGMSLALSALRLAKPGDKVDFLKIPVLSVSETNLDLTGRQVSIGSFSTQKGTLSVNRSVDGKVDILKLIPPAPTGEETAKKTEAAKKPVAPEKPWVVSLKQMLLEGYAVRLTDHSTPEPVILNVQNVRLKGENISTAKNSKAKIAASLALNGKGSLSASGTFGIDPMAANVRVSLKGMEIAPFQPYFNDRVRMTVTGGAFATNGSLSFGSDKLGQTQLAYLGDASLANFSSIDKASGEDFLKAESLSLNNLGFRLAPLSVSIKGIALTNFYAYVGVTPEGKVNLQEVLASSGPQTSAASAPGTGPAASPEKKEPPKDIRIDQVTLQGGKIDFVDNSLRPQFSTHLTEIGGRVSGLSAAANTTADVDLRGKLNDYTPLEITGKINPLTDSLLVDLKARIKDLDLSPATPYAGKYAGYAIEKGKLSLDVKYSINGRKLDSQNEILIDQFNFGQKVESPDATKLPVRLAVALLKDRRGVIKLDLPVTGSLDDPKFSVWKVVLKIIVNLIGKAATSPFALLGAAFGGGEELSYVEFDYGSATITDPGMKKITTLAKSLGDRPALKLDVMGRLDMEKDRDALRQLLFKRKIKAQKLKEITKRGEAVPSVDDVKVEPAEYEKYLTTAYKAEKFPKPKNFIGLAKSLPVPEMEKLMLTHTEVTDNDLRNLALQRATKVRDALMKSGQIGPERVFMVEPKLSAPDNKEKLKGSRVDFTLK